MKCSYCELQQVRRDALKEDKFVVQLGNSVYAVKTNREPLAKPGNWVGWSPIGLTDECYCDHENFKDFPKSFDTTIVEPVHRRYLRKSS